MSAEAVIARTPAVAPRADAEHLAAGAVEVDVADLHPWPAPPAPEAFHGPAGAFVRLVAPVSEADPAALLLQFLVFAGCYAGPDAYVLADGSRLGGNLALLVVGRSAKARKGTSFARVRSFFELVDRRWTSASIVSGGVSGEGLIHRVRDASGNDKGIADKRLLVHEPEFASVLRVAQRQGNTLTAVLRQAWDGATLQVLAKNAPARATGAHIATIGHITRADLQLLLTDAHVGNGFANRFLFACAARAQVLPDGGVPPEDELRRLAELVRENLKLARGRGAVPRDEEASEIWHVAYHALADSAEQGMVDQLLARAEAHIVKLSLVYALLDGAPMIEGVHLLAALAVWDYCAASVRHLFGGRLGDPDVDTAYRAIRVAGAEGRTASELYDAFGRKIARQKLAIVLRQLVMAGLIVEVPETRHGPGRRAKRFVAVEASRGR